MTSLEVWIVIGTVSAAALVSRALFVAMPTRLRLGEGLVDVLDLLPAAAFAALVAPAVLVSDGSLELFSARMGAGCVAVLVARLTGNMAVTLVAGLVVIAALG